MPATARSPCFFYFLVSIEVMINFNNLFYTLHNARIGFQSWRSTYIMVTVLILCRCLAKHFPYGGHKASQEVRSCGIINQLREPCIMHYGNQASIDLDTNLQPVQ